MYRCAQCGATLQSEKQTCPRCSDQREAPVLPTLFGFGEESIQEAQKTVQMIRKPEHPSPVPLKSRPSNQTNIFGTSVPVVPEPIAQDHLIEDDFMAFDSDDSTEVTSKQSQFGKRSFSSVSDQRTEIIDSEDEIDFTLSEGFEDGFSDVEGLETENRGEEADFDISIPPPPPPTSDPLNSINLRNIANPFAKASTKQITSPTDQVLPSSMPLKNSSEQGSNLQSQEQLKAKVLWFNSDRNIRHSIKQQEALIVPNTHQKVATVHLNQQDFSFKGALNQEIWQPIKDKIEITQEDTLRSGSLIIKWLEMTVENTEVISQPSMAIWAVKANQERVFYGAFNLFPGISRVGGEICEISLPFVKTRGPIFTVELDLNGHLWCRSYAQRELWSLVHSTDRLAYGQILATQGKLFTIIKDLGS